MEATGKGSKAAKRRTAKKERSTGYNPEECPVCLTVFEDTVQRPRTLPCGHTVCTLCVNKLKQEGHVACPVCRVSHAVPKGETFPINYALEAFIRRTGNGETAAAASLIPSAGTGRGAEGAAGQKEAAGLPKKMRSFLQEQEASVVAAITVCQEVQAQLDQYQTTLTGWRVKQQQLEDRLQGLLNQSRSAMELVRQEESRAAAKKEEAREGERQLRAALEVLRTPAGEQEAHVAIVEVHRCTFEAKKVFEECRGSFPDANTANTVRKVREASNAALEAFQTAVVDFHAVQAALEADRSVAEEQPRQQCDSEAYYTIGDRLKAILTPGLKAEDLRSPTQPVRRLLEAGRVFGVHQVGGRRRHARISLEAGRLYLHTLKDGPLPPGAKGLQVSQVVPPTPPCVVFLDLSWPGSASRRVHVRLSPDTTRGRQAVLLCTGQRGPSYAGTRLFEVERKGRPGESVWGGDYESNDGEGGAALLPGVSHGRNSRESDKVGVVMGARGGDPAGAQFGINTRKRKDGRYYVDVFGEVVQGLDTVVAAAQHKPITEVTVQDCGVVL